MVEEGGGDTEIKVIKELHEFQDYFDDDGFISAWETMVLTIEDTEETLIDERGTEGVGSRIKARIESLLLRE